MKIMMADGKESTVETPTYIVTSDRDNAAKKGGITKKHVVIGVIVVAVIGIILAAILIGVHFFTQAQKDIVKFSLQFKGSDDQNAKQDVESDPNDNVVMTTVTKGDQIAYIVNDFNRGIQTVKLVTPDGTNCYVNALNKTLAMDPKYITDANSMQNGKKQNSEETFKVSEDPVADRTFLSKKAQDVCKGISLYWVTRVCGQQIPDNSTAAVRNKRTIYYMQPYCNLPGLGGCCKAYWACSVKMTEYVSGSYHTCYTYLTTGTCCGTSPCCNNWYYAYWYTPGLAC